MCFFSLYLVCGKQDSLLPFISLTIAEQMKIVAAATLRSSCQNEPQMRIKFGLTIPHCRWPPEPSVLCYCSFKGACFWGSGQPLKPKENHRGMTGIPDCKQITGGEMTALKFKCTDCLIQIKSKSNKVKNRSCMLLLIYQYNLTCNNETELSQPISEPWKH